MVGDGEGWGVGGGDSDSKARMDWSAHNGDRGSYPATPTLPSDPGTKTKLSTYQPCTFENQEIV